MDGVLYVKEDADAVLCEVGVVVECDGCPDSSFGVDVSDAVRVEFGHRAAVYVGVEDWDGDGYLVGGDVLGRIWDDWEFGDVGFGGVFCHGYLLMLYCL